jgi:hypothetical protein
MSASHLAPSDTEPHRMEAITRFSLATHTGPYQHWPSRTALLDDGSDTGRAITGYVLDGQYHCEHGYLLIVSYDCPYEESYSFLLLDDDLTERARCELVVPYGSYLLHAHWPVSANTIRLHFYARLIYTLTVEPRRWWWRPAIRLRLRRVWNARSDPRTRTSIEALERSIAQTKDALRGVE